MSKVLLEDNFLTESKKVKLDDAPVVNLVKPQREITFIITDPTKISGFNAFKVFIFFVSKKKHFYFKVVATIIASCFFKRNDKPWMGCNQKPIHHKKSCGLLA